MRLRLKYRRGLQYKHQKALPTPAGGDAHLNKHLHHSKLTAEQKKRLPPQPDKMMVVKNGRARMVTR